MSLRGGSSPATLAAPARGKDNTLAAKERAAAKERSADHRRVKAEMAAARGGSGTDRWVLRRVITCRTKLCVDLQPKPAAARGGRNTKLMQSFFRLRRRRLSESSYCNGDQLGTTARGQALGPATGLRVVARARASKRRARSMAPACAAAQGIRSNTRVASQHKPSLGLAYGPPSLR